MVLVHWPCFCVKQAIQEHSTHFPQSQPPPRKLEALRNPESDPEEVLILTCSVSPSRDTYTNPKTIRLKRDYGLKENSSSLWPYPSIPKGLIGEQPIHSIILLAFTFKSNANPQGSKCSWPNLIQSYGSEPLFYTIITAIVSHGQSILPSSRSFQHSLKCVASE